MVDKVKVDKFEMIATFLPTGQKVRAVLIVETKDNCDQDEAIGEIQSNFLWEQFEFDINKIGHINQLASDPVNVYGEVTVVQEN